MMTIWQKWILAIIILALLISTGLLISQSSHYLASQIRDRLGLVVDEEQLTVRFLAIGQGDATLITLPGGDDVLIDGGPDDLVTLKLGRYLPWHDREIEYLIITHPHSDHIVGLLAVLARYRIGQVITTGVNYDSGEYQRLMSEIDRQKIPIKIIEQPEDLTLGEVKLQFIRPDHSLVGTYLENVNNASVVFRLVYGEAEALMMGDYEDEETLVDEQDKIKADLLKVGHHGSSNASDREFIRTVDPDYGVIPVGADNRYGHPDYRTIYNLEQIGAGIWRTDLAGDVVFTTRGDSWLAPLPSGLK